MSLHSHSDIRASTQAIGKAIRDREKYTQVQPFSNHVQILREHGEKISAPTAMIEVYEEFAKPDTTGGVVVLLKRPSTTEQTRCGGGYYTVLSKTKTLREVARLILVATNGALTIEEATILDAFPLHPEDTYDPHDTKGSSTLLSRLLAAKRPDIIISCFRAGEQGLIRLLQHPGVGHESNERHLPISVGVPSHEMKKVDAFHPSFAVNYHPDIDCFAKLLELQFAKAFGEWCGTWQEAPWMDKLHAEARDRKALVTKTTGGTGAMVYRPAQPLMEQEVERTALKMATIKLSDAPRAGCLDGITIGSGNRALLIPQAFLDGAKSLRSEKGSRVLSGIEA